MEPNKDLRLVVNTTNFEIKIYNKFLIQYLEVFKNELISYKFQWNPLRKKSVMMKDKEFYLIKKDGTHVFPIGCLKRFLSILGNSAKVKAENIELIRNKNELLGRDADLKFREEFVPREYQQDYVDVLTEKWNDILLVDLQTGKGKTFIAMNAICKLKKKTAIVILASYIEKWLDDVEKYTHTPKDKVYVVKGEKSWREIMTMPEEEIDKYDFYIFSTRTLSNLFNSYLSGDYPYDLNPTETFNRLGIGVLLSDETHQEFHVVFRTLLMFQVDKVIALSATLDSNQPKMRYLYSTMFPDENRISNIIKYDKYIEIINVAYQILYPNAVKHQSSQGYSHTTFEQSIMKRLNLLKAYKDMIFHYIEEGYIKRKKPGEKCLIFCGTINMCKYLAEMANRQFNAGKNKFDIRTYIEEDPYENIMEADICFSTVLSSGTAVDIPNLLTVIQTTVIASLQQNVQALGRLRRLKDRDVKFYCIFCKNMQKQYHINSQRISVLKPLSKSFKLEEYRNPKALDGFLKA